MRQRKKRTTRSLIVLDICKLYSGGVSMEFDKAVDIGAFSEDDFEVDFFQHVLAANPVHHDALEVLGDAYRRIGDYEKGLELDLRLAQLKPDNEMVRYGLACSYALAGQTDDALRNLSKAVDLGYKDVEHLCKDHDLAVLKADPRFQNLVQKLVEQKNTKMK